MSPRTKKRKQVCHARYLVVLDLRNESLHPSASIGALLPSHLIGCLVRYPWQYPCLPSFTWEPKLNSFSINVDELVLDLWIANAALTQLWACSTRTGLKKRKEPMSQY